MSDHDIELVKRHEGHFNKIFTALDNVKDNYIKFPTFVTTIVTVALSWAALFGILFGFMWSNVNKNSSDVLEVAKKQIELRMKQNSLEKTQDITIDKLILALKEVNATKH